jgi:hypothetical protein
MNTHRVSRKIEHVMEAQARSRGPAAWLVPQDKDRYAYTFNEPEARAAAAAGLRELRGMPSATRTSS